MAYDIKTGKTVANEGTVPQAPITGAVSSPQVPQQNLSQGQLATQQAVQAENVIAQRQGTALQPVPNYQSAPNVNAGNIGTTTQSTTLPTGSNNTSNTTAAGAIGAAQGNNQVLLELQKQADTAKEQVAKEQSTYDKFIEKFTGKSQAIANAEQAAGVPALQATASALTQEYQNKTLGYNAQFQQIQQQPGLTVEQKNNQINAITRNHALEMSDLSIRQNIAQGNYQAAQAMVDKKVEIEYGDLKDLISFQSQILSDAKSSLSDKEKTKLNVLLQENERQYAEATYQAHSLQDTKTKLQIEAANNGASPGVIAAIQSAKTEGDVIASAGKYVGLLDRQLQQSQLATNALQRQNLISEINARNTQNQPINGVPAATVAKIQSSKENQTINGILPAIQAIKSYQDAVKRYGTNEVVSGQGSGELSGTYGNAIAAWKTLAGLGALSGADFALAENAIPAPSFFSRTSTTKGKLDSSLNNAVKQAETLTTRLSQNYPQAKNLLDAQLDDVRVIAYPDKYIKGPDGKVYEKQ